MPKRKQITLQQARNQIASGDLLLFIGTGLVSRLIAAAGRSPYSHAARAIWWCELLFCCEVREFKGGRAVTLESQVARHPGAIDVFETNPENRWPDYHRQGANHYMLRLAGCDYGYFGVMRAALRHLPFVRVFWPPDMNDEKRTDQPPYCSHACVMADRIGGGIDPVPHLSDGLTEPADLAHSPFYRYRFTLSGV